MLPTFVESSALKNQVIKRIIAGSSAYYCITESEELFSWGIGKLSEVSTK